MNTEAGRTKQIDGELERKIKRKNYLLIIALVIIIVLIIVIIVIAVSGADSDTSPSSSPADNNSWVLPDESEFDDGSGASLDCTPNDKVWNSAGFYTISICDGLYAYGDGFYNGMFLVTSTGIIFVDAPPSMWNVLPVITSTVTNNSITTIIYSHHHGDHISGAPQLPNIDNADIICHRNCYEAIERRPEIAPQCTTILDLTADNDTYIIQDGDKYIIFKYTGYRYHTSDDLMIFAPRQRTVMLVDVIFPKWIPFKNLGMAMDPDGYITAHYDLLNLTSSIYDEWENLVAGHVDQLGTREDVNINLDYVHELFEAVHEAEHNANLSFVYVLGNEFGWNVDGTNNWDIVASWQNGISQECTRIMIEDYGWDAIFNGFTVYSDDNCFWALEESHINLE